jgi:hypothetical protein
MDSEGYLFTEWLLRDADEGMAYVAMLGVAGGVCACSCVQVRAAPGRSLLLLLFGRSG